MSSSSVQSDNINSYLQELKQHLSPVIAGMSAAADHYRSSRLGDVPEMARRAVDDFLKVAPQISRSIDHWERHAQSLQEYAAKSGVSKFSDGIAQRSLAALGRVSELMRDLNAREVHTQKMAQKVEYIFML